MGNNYIVSVDSPAPKQHHISLINQMTNIMLDCESNDLIPGARFVEISSVFSFPKDCKAFAFTFNYEGYKNVNVILIEMLY